MMYIEENNANIRYYHLFATRTQINTLPRTVQLQILIRARANIVFIEFKLQNY